MDTTKKKKKTVWDDDYYKTYDTSNGFGSAAKWQDAFEQRMNFKVLSTEEKTEHKGVVQPLYDAYITKDKNVLKKAYYALMMIHHPDKNNGTVESKVITQLISDTYFELRDKL